MPAATWKNHFIEKLVDSSQIDEICISPSGKKVAYTVTPFGQKREKKCSSLWVADIGVPGSNRKLDRPPGSEYYKFSIKWSPDGTIIAFLSNMKDESYGLYGVQVSEIDQESTLVKELHEGTEIDLRNISKFWWSPDSKRIAFLAPDEKDEEEKRQEESGDDVEIFGDWKYTRPYVLNFETLEVTKLYNKNAQVETLAWSPDGSQILLVIHQTPELDSPFYSGIRFETVSVEATSTSSPTFLCEFPGPVLGDQPIWTSSDSIFFLSGATPRSTNSSMTLYRLDQDDGTWAWEKYSHGDVDCVVDLRSDHGIVFGDVQSGLSDEIHVLSSDGKKMELVLYSEQEKINAWDVRATDDGGYVLALSKSNTLNPLQLYTVKIESPSKSSHSIDDFTKLEITLDYNDKARDHSTHLPLHATNLTQITNHNQDLADSLNLEITSQVITCKSDDLTTDLDAIFIAPSVSPSKPLPTCIFIHGGAYDRTTFSFNSNSNYHHWQALILSLSLPESQPSFNPQNIGILAPNYRGGSGRGEKFASWTKGRVGTVEYDDIITLVSEGIKLGLVDPERIIVGGWSQGGILSYLLATRRNLEAKVGEWKIKGAICGAGGSDLDMLVQTSDKPFMQAEGIGGPPWDKDRDDSIAENASAIKRIRKEGAAENMPSVLILHSKEDKRIPVSQAKAFHMACVDYGVEVEMAVYPREGHIVGERAHLMDMLERVERFCGRLLS